MSQRAHVAAKLASGLAREVVRTFGGIRLRVTGTSMVPAICPGDMVSVQRAALNGIAPGQVVVFEREGRLIVHRAIECNDDAESPLLITRGDRLRYDDLPVSPSEFLGRVTSIERGGRKIEFDGSNRAWMRPIILLLRRSNFATSAYLKLHKLLAAGTQSVAPLQRGTTNHGKQSAEKASLCRA